MSDMRQDIAALVPRLRRFAYTLCGNRDDGDDLVQTACVKALRRMHQFQQGTRLDSWMFRIVQNTHLDSLRMTRRRSETVPDELLLVLQSMSSEFRLFGRRLQRHRNFALPACWLPVHLHLIFDI